MNDSDANIKLARHQITEKYPHIINIHCIAHAINFIFKDICKTSFANKVLCQCIILVKYFKSSHLSSNILLCINKKY